MLFLKLSHSMRRQLQEKHFIIIECTHSAAIEISLGSYQRQRKVSQLMLCVPERFPRGGNSSGKLKDK